MLGKARSNRKTAARYAETPYFWRLLLRIRDSAGLDLGRIEPLGVQWQCRATLIIEPVCSRRVPIHAHVPQLGRTPYACAERGQSRGPEPVFVLARRQLPTVVGGAIVEGAVRAVVARQRLPQVRPRVAVRRL